MVFPVLPLHPEHDVLIVVDVQPDFMPGGALPVPEGDAVLLPVNALLHRFDHAVATQDWHPANHSSFSSQHPGIAPFTTVPMFYGPQVVWPDHCVQGTAGAALHPGLYADRLRAVFRKGFRLPIDSYSGFTENDGQTETGLSGYLRGTGARRLFLCGLATDFCVSATATHAAERGFETWVVEDATRGIGAPLPTGGTTMDTALATMATAGVRMVRSAALLG